MPRGRHRVARRSLGGTRNLLVPTAVLALVLPMTGLPAGADPIVVPPGYQAELFLDGLEVPNDLAFDPTGGLFVSETEASRVSRVGILPDGSAGDTVVVASGIADAEGLALADDGVLYVSNLDVVYRVADGVTAPFAGGFADAEGLAIDPNGDLFVADDSGPSAIRITKVEVLPGGTAGTATEVVIVPGGSAADIDFGPNGDLFVANNDDAVWMVEFGDDGTVSSLQELATFPSEPFALAFDRSGTLFVGMGQGGTIWSVQPGERPSLFASGFALVQGLAFDTSGSLYASTVFPNQIWRIALTALPVAIDIKPGAYPNSLNIDGHGVIPVAVLGSEDFDVTQIDIATLDFAGLEVKTNRFGKVQCSFEDVSGDFTYPEGAPDGYLDLVCQFVDDPDRWSPDNGTATLTGLLLPEYGGTAFSGSDEYRIVPPCRDPLGCAVYGADDPIVIGAALALTGLPDLGFGELRGVQLAVSLQEELFGRSLAVVSEDAQCSPDGGASAATALVADSSVAAVVGTTCSSSAQEAAPILTAAGFSMVSPSNTAPALTDPGTHQAGYLRVAYNDRIQAVAMAGFAHTELAAATSAVVHQDGPYAEALAVAFVQSFTDLGGTNLTVEVLDPGSPDIGGAIANVIAAGPPDLIYLLAFEPLGSEVVAEIRAQPDLAGAEIATSEGVLFPSEPTEGVYATAVAPPSGPAYDAFAAAYLAEFGEPPATFDAYAFDAANMILEAITDVGAERGSRLLIGRQELREALFATAGLEGATGTISCDAFGDCAAPQTVQLWQVQGGEFVLVAP